MGSTQSVGQPNGEMVMDNLRWLGLKIWNIATSIWCRIALCHIVLYIFYSLFQCLISLDKWYHQYLSEPMPLEQTFGPEALRSPKREVSPPTWSSTREALDNVRLLGLNSKKVRT